MLFSDALGMVGVVCVLGAYWLLQTERLDSRDRAYSALNAVGAALILASLIYDFNLPSAIVESAWLAISLYGLARPRTPDAPPKTPPATPPEILSDSASQPRR